MDHNSLAFVADFENRIRRAEAEPAQERFVREFIADVAEDCPLSVLTQIATCVLNIRKQELKAAAEGN